MRQKKNKFEHEEKLNKKILISFVFFSIIFATTTWFFSKNFVAVLSVFFGVIALFFVYSYSRRKFAVAGARAKMEEVFPDFIELMASNLRAGMTIDRALLISSRKEFAPLDKEILRVGKAILTGEEIDKALLDMAQRIGSEKIRKTVLLINSGIRSGGNLSVLLEQSANYMRERNFVEKRAASNVLMYVIFIFFAVALGAPALFGLSSVLVEILTNILSGLPTDQVNVNLPFAITRINISVDFVVYFSVVFILVMGVLASLILGLVGKGNERDGVKYIPPIAAIGLAVFFGARIFLSRYFSNFFG